MGLNRRVAELIFFTGPMDCGKSTLALQVDYTQSHGGRSGRVFTCFDRGGDALVSSRIGLTRPAIEVGTRFDFWAYTIDQLMTGNRVDYLVCDEAQFYTPVQIDQLARVVDHLRLDVFCFGILTDFRTELFPGSRRLVELADRVETLQVQPLCWCGAPATHNARISDGQMITSGAQVAVGDTDGESTVQYEVLCRRHHLAGVTAAKGRANPFPDPLPLGEDDPEDEPVRWPDQDQQDLGLETDSDD